MHCICTLCTAWERIAIKSGLMIGLTVCRPHIPKSYGVVSVNLQVVTVGFV